ncbi:hypothetical protein QI30_14315 [Kurthia sp. 3B1D]|uniref:Uncharacterized protein n=1 Tax=Candidatus Kurthia intestinigallinarum TaxID=1562256 RepID=A0A433RRC9_9BACL|nr:hypothetical protein [Kurthia sp. 3B1D]RUS53743.1 hypothetical protein QI30_14315 [Kurthia sp. 3B1D]
MNIYLLITSSVFLLFIAGNAFYVTFKTYEDDDDFTFNGITWIEVLFSILLLITEKTTSDKFHTITFKILSFIFGLFFLGLAVLSWILFI